MPQHACGPFCHVARVPAFKGERRTYRGIAQSFPAHAHSHYVIGRVREGRRTLELNGRSMPIGPGDLMVFNPGDVHGCRHAGPTPFAYDSVTIEASIFEGAPLRFPGKGDAAASAAFERALRLLDDGREEQALEQVLHLASLLRADGERASAVASEDGVAMHAYSHLQSNLAKPQSIADLAAGEGIADYALVRTYRRAFSITPAQHLASMRIDRACRMLSEGAAPSAVAAATGFCDQAHLTRTFKQRIGTTPAAYRRMCSAKEASA